MTAATEPNGHQHDRTLFRASGFSWRLLRPSGIEQSLCEAVEAPAANAPSSLLPSVNRRTDTVRRIAAALGDRYAGV